VHVIFTDKVQNQISSQEDDVSKVDQCHQLQKEEEAVTPCTRDYVATNGWLSKFRNRLASGTARNPCFKQGSKRTLSFEKSRTAYITYRL
jgi:hypothetical protein